MKTFTSIRAASLPALFLGAVGADQHDVVAGVERARRPHQLARIFFGGLQQLGGRAEAQLRARNQSDGERKFFGEPSFPVFEFEPFEKLIRPWPTREAYDRFVEVVEELAAQLP